MITMNNYDSLRSDKKQKAYSLVLVFIHKTLIVICMYFIFGLMLQYVYAATGENADPYQSKHGSVWLLPDNGIYIEALQMRTDVDYEVTGAIARAKVKQRFKNSSSLWAEGLYVFPLPEQAAVDHFRMIIGERIIEGQVKERITARKTYQQAKAAGKKASLIEQQRPNVFTTALANIAPGEEITVEFEYQQILDYNDGSYRLRFPMVVGPRYHAAANHTSSNQENLFNAEAQQAASIDDTSVLTETDPVNRNNNPTRIHILLDAGASLYDLSSSYHPININQTSENRYSISTIGDSINADRDFELVWKAQLNSTPQISAFTQDNNKAGNDASNYTMVTLLPPDLSHLQQRIQARDVVFVIDISGSMAGTSIDQAKASLITALDGLSSIDRFNIIWFNDDTGSLFPETIDATAEYKNYAKRFIDNLDADGGTEMKPALQHALSGQETFSRFRQVIFITDGNINNEIELFDVIDRQLGNSRLFTIGIGSAPNSYFMRKAARKGRGTFTYIGDINEVHAKTTALLKKIENPALINIQLMIDGSSDHGEYEVFPKTIADLYAGETAMLVFKGKGVPDHITIMGDYGNNEWQASAKLRATTKDGIRVAWAREKIASLMDQLHQASTRSGKKKDNQSIQQQITETALQHHLVSRFTSMVAVDITPANSDGMLYRERLKNNLPHGWKQRLPVNGIMLAQAAAGTERKLLLSMIMFIIALLIYRWNREVKSHA
ncbi:MAG: marine proteobacterial sortase target protein [Gammaproteobacteria bacterium]|nr:marine proteobacterial sortase target protein [Gammaproteobacteria bacterium]NNJ50331.1 marine proteobacterial sortase target protein [Gammaproteobacteria bacterium]